MGSIFLPKHRIRQQLGGKRLPHARRPLQDYVFLPLQHGNQTVIFVFTHVDIFKKIRFRIGSV